MKYIIIILCVIFCFTGCGKINNNNSKNKIKTGVVELEYFNFKVDFLASGCNSTKNKDIIEIVDNKGKLHFFTKDGVKIVNNLDILKDHIIIDDVAKVIVAYDNLSNKLCVYDFNSKLTRTIRMSANIKDIYYVKFDKPYFLIFTNDNKVGIYTITSDRFRYKRKKIYDEVIAVNVNYDNDEYVYITKDGNVYKDNIVKHRKPKKLGFISSDLEVEKIAPLHDKGFIISDITGLYCINNSSRVFFSQKFENMDSSVISSYNGDYLLIQEVNTYKNKNKEVKEKSSSLFDINNNKELWNKGSLFKPAETIAVLDNGNVLCLEAPNLIGVYDKEYFRIDSIPLSANVTSYKFCGDYLILTLSDNTVSVISFN